MLKEGCCKTPTVCTSTTSTSSSAYCFRLLARGNVAGSAFEVHWFLVAALRSSLASSSLGAEDARESGLDRPVLRPVPESSLTSPASSFLRPCTTSNSSSSGEKLFSLDMV